MQRIRGRGARMPQTNQLQQNSFAFSWCFPVISALGATALCLGIVTLFTARKNSVVSALPHLAAWSTDWLLLNAGVFLLFASSVILGVKVQHNRTIGLAWIKVDGSAMESRTREFTMLKPSSSKILAVLLNLLLLGIGLPAFAVVTFLMKPSGYMIFVVCFFFLTGFIILKNAADSLSCRVQMFDDEIRFSSYFRAKAFPVLEIRSAKYSRYRGTTSLTVLGDRSWFTVSSDSFDSGQLDAIRKFCDRAANLYPDWSSQTEVGVRK